jgi:hypothetical protein
MGKVQLGGRGALNANTGALIVGTRREAIVKT